MIKLGKKLEITDRKEIIKLLVDGAVFYDGLSNSLKFVDYRIVLGNTCVSCLGEIWHLQNWYYPVATYTINGVELVDERVKELGIGFNEYYVCDCIRPDYFNYANSAGSTSPHLHKVIERNLLHKTKEAAILHTKAMMKVSV